MRIIVKKTQYICTLIYNVNLFFGSENIVHINQKRTLNVYNFKKLY